MTEDNLGSLEKNVLRKNISDALFHFGEVVERSNFLLWVFFSMSVEASRLRACRRR